MSTLHELSAAELLAGYRQRQFSPVEVARDVLQQITRWEPHLAATSRPVRARLAQATADAVGLVDGGTVTVSNDAGSLTLPWVATEMPDGVVWLPTYSPGSHVHDVLRVTAGAVVRLAAGGAQ